MNRRYKIVLVGPAHFGKSTFIHTLGTLHSTHNRYKPTMGTEIHPIKCRDVDLNIWDCGGKFEGLRDGYYMNSDGAIIYLNGVDSPQNQSIWLSYYVSLIKKYEPRYSDNRYYWACSI